MTATSALLPTRTKMNPAHPKTATFHDPGAVGFIVIADDNPKALRILTTFGTFDDYALGAKLDMRHDQTGARLGIATVVGRRGMKWDGKQEGIVPDKPIPHYVFK